MPEFNGSRAAYGMIAKIWSTAHSKGGSFRNKVVSVACLFLPNLKVQTETNCRVGHLKFPDLRNKDRMKATYIIKLPPRTGQPPGPYPHWPLLVTHRQTRKVYPTYAKFRSPTSTARAPCLSGSSRSPTSGPSPPSSTSQSQYPPRSASSE